MDHGLVVLIQGAANDIVLDFADLVLGVIGDDSGHLAGVSSMGS